MNTDEDLYELALRASETPRVDAEATLHVLSDMLLEQGLIEAPSNRDEPWQNVLDWVRRAVRPRFIEEEGSWIVDVCSVSVQHSARGGTFYVTVFQREGFKEPSALAVRVATSPSGSIVPRNPSDLPSILIQPGRHRLTVRKIKTRSGKYFFQHEWAAEPTERG